MELPSIENLRCFVAAARHLSFRRAAQAVNLTPAAFGQRIAQLEEQFDAKLFTRTTRKVELTEAGLNLLPEAEKTLQQAAACVLAIAPDARPNVRVSLGTRFELGVSWVMPSVIAWELQRQDVTFDVYFGAGPDILAQLEKGLVDAIITSAAVAHRSWHVEMLHQEEYVFVASPGYLDKHPFKSPDQSPRHTLIDIDASLPLTRYLSSASRTAWTFADIRLCGMGEAMRQMCLANRGCCVLPRYMIEEDLTDGRLKEIFPGMPTLGDSFRLLFPHHSPYSAQLIQWADFLRGRALT